MGNLPGKHPDSDNYLPSLNVWADFGPFDLTDADDAELSFDYSYEKEWTHDRFGWILASPNPGHYGTVHGTEYLNDSTHGWKTLTVDLSEYISQLKDYWKDKSGEPRVWLSFYFKSDGSVEDGFGAMIDNVRLTKWVESQVLKPVLFFPQYANGGSQGGFLNTSRIILRNNGDRTESGQIVFRSPGGALSGIPIGGVSQSSVDYSLGPWASMELITDGTGPLVFGSVLVTSDQLEGSNLEGTEVFELQGHSVSVGNSPLRASHQVYVSVTSEEDTGIAAFNPDSEEPVRLDLYLLDELGTQVATAELTLQPMQQKALFVTEADLFQSYFDSHQHDFCGTLNIHARDERTFSVLGLILKRDSGALVAVSASAKAFKP
jgi:hypothetical protein